MPIFVYVWSRRAEQVTTSPGLCGNDPRRRRSECDERSSRLAAILAVRTYPGANPGASRPSARTPRPDATPAPCSTDSAASHFAGISGESDIAAGEYSAILGGSGNSACSTYDAIGTGEDNTIGLQSTDASPYIGACQGNAVDALAAQLHA